VLRQDGWIDERFVWLLWYLAQLAELEEAMERAAVLHGAAESLRNKHMSQILMAADNLEEIARHVARVRARLGEEAYAAALAEGGVMSLEEALAYALEEHV
jgi:hypothetical protein